MPSKLVLGLGFLTTLAVGYAIGYFSRDEEVDDLEKDVVFFTVMNRHLVTHISDEMFTAAMMSASKDPYLNAVKRQDSN